MAWVPMIWCRHLRQRRGFLPRPRPYGALLLLDFLPSPEGQKMLIETFKHGSAVKDYGLKLLPEEGFTTSQYDQIMDKWQNFVSEFARK